MKIVVWMILCCSLILSSKALDCQDSSCLNQLCPLMTGRHEETGYTVNLFKCPYDNFCMKLFEKLTWGAPEPEHDACTYCPRGGNEEICNDYCEDRLCDGNVSKCYYTDDICDGVDHCPNRADEKGCRKRIAPVGNGGRSCRGFRIRPEGRFLEDSISIRYTNLRSDQRRKLYKNINRPYIIRPYKCPNDDVCLEHEKDFCHKCPSGGKENICVEDYCSKLKLDENYWREKHILEAYGNNVSFHRCPYNNKCISIVEQCDGKIDCPNGDDETNCDEKTCKDIGKFKCHNEEHCIPMTLACDGDETVSRYVYNIVGQPYVHIYGYSYGYNERSLINPYKCQFNYDEWETVCQKHCPKDHFACPYEIGKANLTKLCIPYHKACYIPKNIATVSNLTTNGYLWRCSQEQNQWIETSRLCDGILDCYLNEDESQFFCDTLAVYQLIQLTLGSVVTVVVLLVFLTISGIKKHPTKCSTCMQQHQHKFTEEEWVRIQTMLSLLFKHKCKEWINAAAITNWNSQKKLEDAYQKIHNRNSSMELKAIYRYIHRRIEVMLNYSNRLEVMRWRHASIYKVLFDFEIKLHGDDEISAIQCIQQKLGTSLEAFSLMDFKQSPSFITKCSVTFSTIMKRVKFNKLIVPMIKVTFFVLDIIKDIGLLIFISSTLFIEGPQNKQTLYDYYLFGISLAATCIGQVAISVYAFKNRYAALSICVHNTPTTAKVVISTIIVLLFPLSGIWMAWENYIDSKTTEEIFEKIEHSEDWMKRGMPKEDFEAMFSSVNFVEHQNIFGFNSIKMIESMLESFWQVLVFIAMCVRDSYGGVLTEEIFRPRVENEALTTKQFFFYTFSAISYIFICTGITSFIAEKQRNSMSAKEKFVIICIYLMQTAICLYSTNALFALSLDNPTNFPFICYFGFIILKAVVLLVGTILIDKSTLIWTTDLMMFIIANVNLPITLNQFQEDENQTDSSHQKGFKKLILVWVISIVENILRCIIVSVFSSNELLTYYPISIKFQSMWSITMVIEFIVVVSWIIYFKRLYIWKDLIAHKAEVSNKQNNKAAEEILLTTKSRDRNMHDTRRRNSEPGITMLEDYSTNPRQYCRYIYKIWSKFGVESKQIAINQTTPSLNQLEKLIGLDKHKNSKNTVKQNYSMIILFCMLGVVLILINLKDVMNPRKIYPDCFAVLQDRKGPGVYELNFNKDITKFAYCENGMTLIQRTDPTAGNRKHYFDRPFQEYVEGFGYTAKEYWLGLRQIWWLNQMDNHILRLELTMQNNGTLFDVEFDNFKIDHCLLDKKRYNFGRFGPKVNSKSPECEKYQRDQRFIYDSKYSYTEYYPITSVGNARSSLLTNGTVILFRPNFLGTFEEKKGSREGYSKTVHDRLYNGFYTFDREEDGECPRDTKSGWWFPHRVFAPSGTVDHLKLNGRQCDYRSQYDTNLNGFYDDDSNVNQRGIVICNKLNDLEKLLLKLKNLEKINNNYYLPVGLPPAGAECYVRSRYINHEYEFKHLISIKLSKTKMYLGRKP